MKIVTVNEYYRTLLEKEQDIVLPAGIKPTSTRMQKQMRFRHWTDARCNSGARMLVPTCVHPNARELCVARTRGSTDVPGCWGTVPIKTK